MGGCGTALDIALRYPNSLMGFVGVCGQPLSISPRGAQTDMPLHFFNGADDEVVRWSVVESIFEGLRKAGYGSLVVHGPLTSVSHRVSREFESKCISDTLQQCCNH